MPALTFAAIDFETADARPLSACAVGVVRVQNGAVKRRFKSLLRPPRGNYRFAKLHGIQAADTRDAPKFQEVWAEMRALLDGVRFLAAHNASFDLRVLHRVCMHARLAPPAIAWVCTQRLAAGLCGEGQSGLDAACARLGIPLAHHDPLSDAEASAQIVLRAADAGIPLLRRR